MNSAETWREAFNAWWRSRPVCRAVKSPRGFAQMVWQAAFKAADVTVTTDEAGDAVAVTRTDADGRILSVIWERPARHPGSVATQMQILEHLESLKTDPTDDDLIELTAALEMRRALHIVAEVAALPVGGKDADMPTPFQAGYQLACEEIAERIRTQQVVIPGGMVLPACGTLPSIKQPAA